MLSDLGRTLATLLLFCAVVTGPAVAVAPTIDSATTTSTTDLAATTGATDSVTTTSTTDPTPVRSRSSSISDDSPAVESIPRNRSAATGTADTVSASFSSGRYTTVRGGIVEITVTPSDGSVATVQIGSRESGYLANITVKDADGGGVTILFNTYAARFGADAFSVTGGDQIVGTDDDGTVQIGDSASGVLATGDYTLSANGGSSPASFPDALATLVIEDRETGGLNSYTAPAGTTFDSAESVSSSIAGGSVSPGEQVATSDLLVVEINASGLGGLLERQDGTGYSGSGTTARFLDAISDDGDGTPPLAFELVQSQAPTNRDSLDLTTQLDTTNTQTFTNSEVGRVYVVVDLSNVTETPTKFGYNGTFSVDAEGAEPNFISGDDSGETVETIFRLADPTLSIRTNEVATDPAQQISGTTTLAPGTQLRLRLVSQDATPKFVKREQVTVTDDGTFTANFDFTQQAQSDSRLPTPFDARAKAGDIVTTTTTVTLRAEITPTPTASPTATSSPTSPTVNETINSSVTPTETLTPTETPTATPTATPATPTDRTPTTDNATATATGTPTRAGSPTATPTAVTPELAGKKTPETGVKTSTDIPGFGGGLAVFALLATVVLLTRRRG